MKYEIKEKNCKTKDKYVAISDDGEEKPYLISDLDYVMKVYKWFEDNCLDIEELIDNGNLPELE